ncbi:MAG: CRISPR-associated endonuclease Cas2 [Aeromonas sp.]
MMVLVTYDVSMADPEGPRRLRRLAKLCLDYGVRVQYSVFECEIEPEQWVHFRNGLLKTYDPEVDSLRFYQLGSGWRSKVAHHGAKPALDIFKSDLII